MTDFISFPKIGRLSREMVVTEKLDGTNAQILIVEGVDPEAVARVDGYSFYAGSRARWLMPGKTSDNFGFAQWVGENAPALLSLGVGRHFGEWWGQGIQRGYGLKERRFSLFNVGKWNDENKPSVCHVVPMLYRGPFDTEDIDTIMQALEVRGSLAAPGFMNPEGVVVFHSATNTFFKKTFEKDQAGKEAA